MRLDSVLPRPPVTARGSIFWNLASALAAAGSIAGILFVKSNQIWPGIAALGVGAAAGLYLWSRPSPEEYIEYETRQDELAYYARASILLLITGAANLVVLASLHRSSPFAWIPLSIALVLSVVVQVLRWFHSGGHE